uniref:UDP-glycosyltransferase 75C1-like n=1 Tax=Erigeron canadensis TaxID=72917 RepID=UPI001CB988F0|nr:UDP-glycosyltransferase 75C1-like [Erigeron canadensis]
MAQTQHHFLLVTYPVQGHINPALEFSKRLIILGVKVTFTIPVSAYRKMIKAGRVPEGFNFVVFSDGFDDGFNSNTNDHMLFMTQMKRRGSETLKETILSNSAQNNGSTPITCLVYTPLLPWAAEVARGLNVPSALLWIQPASILRVYYYYFNGYDKLIRDCCNEPSWSIELPGLPSLKSRDLPSFCFPSNPYGFILDAVKEQLDMVASEEKPIIFVNSFDALEEEALKEIDDGKLSMIAIGPLVPRGDLVFEKSKDDDDIMEWMTTKPKGSIVYVAFGSLLVLTKKQKDAIAQGLLGSERPFLWVIRDEDANLKGEEGEENKEKLSCMEELEKLGLIVPWCSQLEVLSHPSLGCFVTHCGWNSTLESIVCGVPVVAFPHWNDQPMNAKLLADVWETGVRVAPNEDGAVEGEEIRKCIEMVMADDEKGIAMRNNANKWKDLASAAVKETGSSNTNLKSFLELI